MQCSTALRRRQAGVHCPMSALHSLPESPMPDCCLPPLLAAITGYKIIAVPIGGGANISVTGVGSALQFSFAGGNSLSAGQQYRFYAYAFNSAGSSPPSAPYTYTVPAT